MKRHLLVVLMVILAALSQAQNWLWAKTGANGSAGASYVLVNANGNIYCNGAFVNSITIDTAVLTGNPWSNGFIAEFSPEGSFMKVARINSANPQSSCSIRNMTNDRFGNIYISGQIHGNVTLDTIHSALLYYGYLAKFTPDVNVLSIKYASDVVHNATFDNQNNTYIVGTVNKNVSYIDTNTLVNPSPQPNINTKLFAAKLDPTGSCQWARQGFGEVSSLSECFYKNNNIYMMGRVDSCMLYTDTNLCTMPPGSSARFLMKTDLGGKPEWIRYQANYKTPYGSSFRMDATGNCYVMGLFDSLLIISGQITEKSQGGGREGYFAKYNNNGDLLWVKHIKCTGNLTGGISTNEQGFTYLAGNFSGFVAFGDDTLFAETNDDMYVARFNSNGDYIGGVTVPNAELWHIAQDADGNAIVTGDIPNGTTMFDNIPLHVTGTQSFFLAKLSAITTGIPQGRLAEDDRLNIYPNPNNKTFTIQVPEALAHGNTAQLGIYDNSGRTIKEETTDISGSRVSVDIGAIEKGTYTVILSNGHKKFTGRVVVQ